MKLTTTLIFYFCNIICTTRFKVEECGIYEERITNSGISLIKGDFELGLDSIRFQNEELSFLKAFISDHGDLLTFGICSSEMFKNTLALNDTTVSKNLTRTFKLILNGIPCDEKFLMTSGVKLSEVQPNKIILSSEIIKVADKDNTEITQQCVDFINSFLENNGRNPRFIKLRFFFGISYDCKFLCSMNMIKRYVEQSGLRVSCVDSFYDSFKKDLEEDLKQMSEKGSSSLSFDEVFDNMCILLRQITTVKNFPLLSIIRLMTSRNGEVQIYRSIFVKLEGLPKGRSLGDYEICFYNESKEQISSKKFNFYTAGDKICLLFTQLVDNGVKFLGVPLNNEAEDIIFYDLKEHLQVQPQKEPLIYH